MTKRCAHGDSNFAKSHAGACRLVSRNLQLAVDAFGALPSDPDWAVGVLSGFCR